MQKINIAELLKNCPTGYPLDCAMYEDVYFDFVDELNIIHCYIQHGTHKTSITFNQHGTPNSDIKSKCVIFPTGKTTWEGIVAPFSNGDIVATDDSVYIGIVRKVNQCETDDMYDHNEAYAVHCHIEASDDNGLYEFETRDVSLLFCRLATEEEKQKLFDAIKENGYRWNAETKTLEKVEPNFKVGDRIRHKEDTKLTCVIKRIDDRYWVYGHPTCYTIPLGEQDDYELVPNKFDINTLKPFESKVLVRFNKDNKWCGSFFSFIDRDLQSYCYKFVTTAGKSYPMMIPYKGNEYLLGKTDDCNEYYKIWE